MCTTMGANPDLIFGAQEATVPVERERRFQVLSMNMSVLTSMVPHQVHQHYLPLRGDTRARIRQKADGYTMTVKRGWGEQRDEPKLSVAGQAVLGAVAKDVGDIRQWADGRAGFPFNELMHLAEMLADATKIPEWLMANLPLRSLNKCRYDFGAGWTLDVYTDPEADGLLVLEYEADDACDALSCLPAWVREVRDITDRVDNSIIADWIWEKRVGLSPWTALERMMPIKRVSLDGGPGCGKTTLIKKIRESEYYQDRVVIVPEAARLMHEFGLVEIPVGDAAGMASFEGAIYRQHQILLEQAEASARRSGIGLIVEDRHPVHPLCYLDNNRELFELACGTTVEREIAQGDMVIYLQMPPRDVYDQMRSGDPTRYEDYDQAVDRDLVYQQVYEAFGDRLIKVPFSEDFSEKEARVFELLDRVLAG